MNPIPKIPLLAVGLLLMAVALAAPRASAQTTPFHPWNWEVGLRSANFAPYFQATNDNFYRLRSNVGPALGYEVFLLQRRPNHTFSRLALGYGRYDQPYQGEVQPYINEAIETGNSFRASAFTMEAAFGMELPQPQRKVLDRFRLRGGLSLAVQALQEQALRLSYLNFAGHHAYRHELSSGGSYWRGTAFFQTEFMVLPHCFVGMEFHFGPTLQVRNQQHRDERLVSNTSGYNYNLSVEQSRGAIFFWDGPVGLPSFNLGFSF